MMTILTLAYVAFKLWAKTSDGTNMLFALIAGLTVGGANPRLCAALLLLLHIALIVF